MLPSKAPVEAPSPPSHLETHELALQVLKDLLIHAIVNQRDGWGHWRDTLIILQYVADELAFVNKDVEIVEVLIFYFGPFLSFFLSVGNFILNPQPLENLFLRPTGPLWRLVPRPPGGSRQILAQPAPNTVPELHPSDRLARGAVVF